MKSLRVCWPNYYIFFSLSGADIGPSTFYTNGNVTVEFTTNESQVFGGFSISYKTVDKVPPLI